MNATKIVVLMLVGLAATAAVAPMATAAPTCQHPDINDISVTSCVTEAARVTNLWICFVIQLEGGSC